MGPLKLVVLLAIMSPHCILGETLYESLGLSSTATLDQIKKAYRTMAKQYHPDKNKEPGAENKFRLISTAYECLSDEEKRRRYDSIGLEGCKKDGGDDFGGGDHPFASFFGSMFGGGHGSESGQQVNRGGDVTIDLPVTLEELFVGEFIEFTRSRSVKKPKPGTRKCNCHMEMKTRSIGPGRFQMVQEQVCSECPNYEFVNEDRQLEVEIELGMRDKYSYPFPGEGEPHADGENGDLKFVIRQQVHSIFHRRGDDLYTNVSISLVDALTGFSFELIHLDGHKVKLSREKVTWPGAILRIPNEGMPNYENNDKKGSLYVTFDVVFPRDKQLTTAESEAVVGIFGDKQSASTVAYGVPMVREKGLAEGHTAPRVYNGFTSPSSAGKHLGNTLR